VTLTALGLERKSGGKSGDWRRPAAAPARGPR
jgi:hypothetical protein